MTYRRIALARAVAATLAAGMLFGTAQPVTAQPVTAQPVTTQPSVARLRRQAATLRARLDRLAVQQGLAVERYDQAREDLRVATTDEVLATTDLVDRQRSTLAAQDAGARRVRAIYQAGGPLGLTATLLSSATLDDAVVRWHTVERLVGSDADQVLARQTSARLQGRRAETAAYTRAQVVARRLAADAAAAAVTATLERQRVLLANTDASILRLVERQRRAAEARALTLAADRARALGLGGVRDARGHGLEGGTASNQRLPQVPAPNGVAAAAIQAAATRLGLPYVWGATGPNSFDCSGLMLWAYARAGVTLPRTSRAQYAGLPHVPLSDLAPGDLVFYATNPSDPSTIHHVGMYVGDGLSLYAPQTGSVVKIGAVGYGRIIGAARPAATG
jgi:cell wall-associated NlpC family hydrolase